ncbi:hypothetical protein GGR56DRAFT_693607 [Xylariaceae sp. FL0804]|nr:hypothetical protein GGR56DRAFT_693607 [Xylariaceae sp. FL0804]
MPPKKVAGAQAKPKRERIVKRNHGKPVSAGRLITSPYAEFGWHKSLSSDIEKVAKYVKPEANSMYCLQLERDRSIDDWSIRNALFWEHRQLHDQRILSTPAADFLDFWSDDDALEETLKGVRRRSTNDGRLEMHYLFETLRAREFLLWPVQIDGVWLTIFLRMDDLSSEERGDDVTEFCDRRVTDIAIVDPWPAGRADRRALVARRLRAILREGCIDLGDACALHATAAPDAEAEWQTGHVAYAVSREFIRRLKNLLFVTQQNKNTNTETDNRHLWADFAEHLNVDAYREGMMAACAHQCIWKAGHRVRLGLEVPSEQSKYDPTLLSRVRGPSVTCPPPEDVPDERWDPLLQPEPSHTHSIPLPAGAGGGHDPTDAGRVVEEEEEEVEEDVEEEVEEDEDIHLPDAIAAPAGEEPGAAGAETPLGIEDVQRAPTPQMPEMPADEESYSSQAQTVEEPQAVPDAGAVRDASPPAGPAAQVSRQSSAIPGLGDWSPAAPAAALQPQADGGEAGGESGQSPRKSLVGAPAPAVDALSESQRGIYVPRPSGAQSGGMEREDEDELDYGDDSDDGSLFGSGKRPRSDDGQVDEEEPPEKRLRYEED